MRISLPMAFSRETISARRDQILQVETARTWSHLRSIANEMRFRNIVTMCQLASYW